MVKFTGEISAIVQRVGDIGASGDDKGKLVFLD